MFARLEGNGRGWRPTLPDRNHDNLRETFLRDVVLMAIDQINADGRGQSGQPSAGKRQAPAKDAFAFDAFLSYSTRHDYQHARKLEAFLESIHLLPAEPPVPPLDICRDGTDFRLPRKLNEDRIEDPVWRIIRAELQRARYLIVLCCPAAAASKWVDREVAWFLENRGADRVLLAVTGGADPINSPGAIFPRAVLDAGLDRARIWYDLRRGRRKTTTKAATDYEDARLRLAADLLGWDSAQKGALVETWLRQGRRKARRIVGVVAATAVLFLAIALVAFWERSVALGRLRDTQVLVFKFLTLASRYDEAADRLAQVELADDRLLLADWFGRQHRSYPATISEPLTEKGIKALAYDENDDLLVGLTGFDEPQLFVVDLTTSSLKCMVPGPIEAREIVSGTPAVPQP